MAIPLPQFLADFGPCRILAPDSAVAALRPVEPPVMASVEASAHRLEEAFARGEEAGREAARGAFEASLAEAREQAEEMLRAERQRWSTEEGGKLAEHLAAGLHALEASIAESVEAVLKPFLASELRRKAVEALAADVRVLLASKPATALRIAGPEDLLAAIAERLGGCPAQIEYQPADTADLCVTGDRTIMETRIQSWIENLGLQPA